MGAALPGPKSRAILIKIQWKRIYISHALSSIRAICPNITVGYRDK